MLDVDAVGSCRAVVPAVFDCGLYLLSCDVYLCWLQSVYFPSNFPVCGVGLVRNSVDELFVEGTCNVFGVYVCVFLESYGVVVLLWWSPVGQSLYSVPAGAFVSSVVPWFFYVFPPDFCLVCAYESGDLFV